MIDGVVLTFFDITDAKMLEAQSCAELTDGESRNLKVENEIQA